MWLLPLLGVSRMKRMDSSFQCWIKDGSRPTAYAVQTVFANHLKVLCSKGMVLNVQVKMLYKQYQVRVKKLNESKPIDEVSKRLLVLQKPKFPRLRRQTVTESCLLVTGIPALRRQELYTGFYSERERLTCWCAKSFAGSFFFILESDCSTKVLQFIL